MAALKHHHRDEEPTVVERGLTALEQLLAVALAGTDRDGSGDTPKTQHLRLKVNRLHRSAGPRPATNPPRSSQDAESTYETERSLQARSGSTVFADGMARANAAALRVAFETPMAIALIARACTHLVYTSTRTRSSTTHGQS